MKNEEEALTTVVTKYFSSFFLLFRHESLTISFWLFKSLSRINLSFEILLLDADTLSAFRFALPMNLDVKS